MASELLTLGQAARLAGVSRQTVHRWVEAGKLQCVTLPPAARRKGDWRYVRQGDVLQLVERGLDPRSGRQGRR